MISLRRHTLTLVAVFLALALGVVLGATSVATSLRDALVKDRDTTAAQLARTETERATADSNAQRLDGMAAALKPVATEKILDQRPVLVIVAPSARAEDIRVVTEGIRRAGGQEAGRITLTDKAVDPAKDSELQALVANLPVGAAPAADTEPAAQLGLALGRAALLRTEDVKPHVDDKAREIILTTLSDSGFIGYERGTIRPGQLTLVIAGAESGPDGVVGRRLSALSRALDKEGSGTVVAAEIPRDSTGDVVSVLRASGGTEVSTVDDLATNSGQLAAVMGLTEQLDQGSGHYGLRPDAAAAIPTPKVRPQS